MDMYDSQFWGTCASCPYDEGEMFRRKERLENDFPDWQPDYCYCLKVDGEHQYNGWCSDPFESADVHITSHKACERRTGRAYRRKMKIQKDDRLYRIVKDRYVPHVAYVPWDFNGKTLNGTSTYIKYSSHSRKEKFLKRQTSKATRRKDIANGNNYRKHYEYWYVMY